PVQARSFSSMIPLMEIIAEVERMGINTKKVNTLYLDLLSLIIRAAVPPSTCSAPSLEPLAQLVGFRYLCGF
ncbi:MAG: hypothetical protein P8075_08550, partial [Deltaproteobacteria bacterium]